MSFVTLGSVLVGSGTALLIAFVAYPWQKGRDRALQVAEEKRLSYQRFFDASEVFFAKLRAAAFRQNPTLPDDEFGKLEAVKADLAFRGGEEAVAKCAAFAHCLKEYRRWIKKCVGAGPSVSQANLHERDKAYRAANDARIEAILAAREDAGIYGKKSASENTGVVFP